MLTSRLSALCRDRSGATAVEYALLALLTSGCAWVGETALRLAIAMTLGRVAAALCHCTVVLGQ
jgi:Flp pilus assembly pilin Flp